MRTRAMRLIAGLSLSTVLAACDSVTSGSNEPEATQYRGLLIDTRSHSVSVNETGPGTAWSIVEVPHVRFEVFDILAADGRRTDRLWSQQGKIHDWNQFKQMAPTIHGSLVLHERFQPDFPDGNPWAFYLLSASDGEAGQPVASVPADSGLERLDLVYVYEDGGLLTASYSAQGRLTTIQAQDHLVSTSYHPQAGVDNPFAAYELPHAITPKLDQPPINDALRRGLGDVTSHAFANAPLDMAFLVRQYELGRLFQVHRRSAKDERSRSQVIRFAKRPYDQQIREAAQRDQTGRPHDLRRPTAQGGAGQLEPSIPDVPLVIGGTATAGGDGLMHVMVHGSPSPVPAEVPLRSVVHFRIEFDENANARFLGSSSSSNDGDRSVWTSVYSYTVQGRAITMTVTVDGRAKTLTVGDQSLELARGNFVRIRVSADLEIAAEQIAVVRLLDAYDTERMVEIFESHIGSR